MFPCTYIGGEWCWACLGDWFVVESSLCHTSSPHHQAGLRIQYTYSNISSVCDPLVEIFHLKARNCTKPIKRAGIKTQKRLIKRLVFYTRSKCKGHLINIFNSSTTSDNIVSINHTIKIFHTPFFSFSSSLKNLRLAFFFNFSFMIITSYISIPSRLSMLFHVLLYIFFNQLMHIGWLDYFPNFPMQQQQRALTRATYNIHRPMP